MQEDTHFYPIKIVSRSIGKRRWRRFYWCTLGGAFGIGCVSALTPLLPTIFSPAQSTAMVAEAPEPKIFLSEDRVIALAEPAAAPPAPVVIAASPEPKPLYPVAVDLKVGAGDTLISMLTDTGVSYEEATNVVTSLRKIFNPKQLGVGQSVTVSLDKAQDSDLPYITRLKLPVSATSHLEATRGKKDDFSVKKINAPTQSVLVRAGGRIDSSLYETGVSSGLPAALLTGIIAAYSYDVDFQRDIHEGDQFDVLFEQNATNTGIVTGYGNVLYASLNLDGKVMKLYRYVDKHGHADYYNEKGESVRKALLRTPINGAHISSGYGMRNHPILGYTKMHRGVDFAAATGTPIYAAGDGVVEFSSRKGGYGNYLKIKHTDKYASAYGHVSRFAAGIAPGKKVKQGQIVAYVGSTGASTGPHLHYEIMVNDQQVNPSGVKFKTGNVLGGKELASFKRNVQQVQTALANAPRKAELAMADADKKKAAN